MEHLRGRDDGRPPLKLGGYDPVAIGLFAIAGAILGLAVVVVYIGMTFLSAIGVEWQWIWEGSE